MTPHFAQPTLYPALVGGAPVYVTGEDRLKLTVRNGLAGVTVRLTGRFLAAPRTEDDDPPGVQAFQQELVPASDRTSSTILLPLGTGWLINAEVLVSAGSPLVGQTYAVLSLVRGDAGATLDLETLAAGYLTALQRIATPAGSIQSSLAGAGALRSIQNAAPAAGADFTIAVPAGARWELLSLFATLTTAVAVANRVVTLTIDDGTHVFLKSSQQQQQAASLAWDYFWAPGDQNQSSGNVLLVTSSLPHRVFLGGGFNLNAVTANLQAADAWSAQQVLVREWIEGA